MNPVIPNDDHLYRIRKPGMFFSAPIDPQYRLGLDPLYRSPFGEYIGLTKRWSFGVLGVCSYMGYLALDVTSASPLWFAAGFTLLSLPMIALQYFTGPHVTRIFRLYKKDEAQTYENLTKDETLVVEQIGVFGKGTSATEIKLKDVKIANERMGWVNWKYIDPESKEELDLYVVDNIGGLKMDRIWGIVEKNSGIDNGRAFLDDASKLGK